MPRNLLNTVGEASVDNLTGDNLIYQKRIQVLLPAGEYHRGQVLVLGGIDTVMLTDENLIGVDAQLPSAAVTKIDCILLDEVGVVTEEVRAAASLTGEWNLNEILWGEIPEAARPAIIKDAWARQLHIAPMNKAPYVQWGEV